MFSRKNIKVMPNITSATEHSGNRKYILTEEQMKFFDENGYIVIKGLIEGPLLESYKKRFSDICRGNLLSVNAVKEYALMKKKSNPEDYIYKIQEILDDEVFMTYSENPKLLDIVAQLIGSDILAVNLMLINKPPECARHPTHQDLFYFPFRPVEKIIGVWTAIDPTTIPNGCLYVVPGSHKCNDLLNHVLFKDSKKFFHCLDNEDTLAPPEKRLNLEMQPGDTIFFHPYLFHGSGPNLTGSYRKALTIHYAASDMYYINPMDTVQREMAEYFTVELKKRGLDGMRYEDIWKLKIKPVRSAKSHL